VIGSSAAAATAAHAAAGAVRRVQIPEAFGFLFEPARYKGAYGGRGSAKSHSFAGALVAKAAENSLRVLCARETQRSIRDSVKRLLDDKIHDYGLGRTLTSFDNEIRGTANDSLFIFSGLRHNISSIKSMEGIDIVWVEEANTMSQESIRTLIPTLRERGSELWFSWNPGSADDPIEKLLRGKELPPGAVVREVSFRDNPWFASSPLQAEMEWDRRRDPDLYRHVWEGEYLKRSESRVFHNWCTDVFEESDLENAGLSARFGADWGFSVDPTVLVKVYVDHTHRKLFVSHEAYKVGCEIEDTPALFTGDCPDHVPDQQRWRNRKAYPGVPGAHRGRITADSARPETIRYMRGRGFDMHPAKKGPNSLYEGVEWMKNYDIVIHERCKHTATEMQHYSYKVDPITEEVLSELRDKHNHVIDATRYAVEGDRKMRRRRSIAAPTNVGDGKQANWARV